MQFRLILAIIACTSSLGLRESFSFRPPPEPTLLRDTFPGQTAPLGLFDPFNLVDSIDDRQLLMLREAELKHGRIAMMASVAILSEEIMHPFKRDVIMAAMHPMVPIFVLSFIAFLEMYSVVKWYTYKKLQMEKVAGDLDFDPLDLCPFGSESYTALSMEFTDMRNKELNNGRLAMIGVAGIVAQELVDKRDIIGHFNEFGFFCAPAAFILFVHTRASGCSAIIMDFHLSISP